MAGLHRRSFIISNASWAGLQTMSRTGPLIRSIADTARWAAVFRARNRAAGCTVSRPPGGKAGRRARAADRRRGPRGQQPLVGLGIANVFVRSIHLTADRAGRRYGRQPGRRSRREAIPDDPSSVTPMGRSGPVGSDRLQGERHRRRKTVVYAQAYSYGSGGSERSPRLVRPSGSRLQKALIITEGIVIYLSPEEVGTLADDLARPASFQSWVVELSSPGLLKILQKQLGPGLSESGASFKFGPQQGPAFFMQYGWKPAQIRSMLKSAAQMKRLSPWMWLLSLLPESTGRQGSRPWSGVTLLSRT